MSIIAVVVARAETFYIISCACLADSAPLPKKWKRHVGLLDAQARRCGDVHLAFEYLGKGSTGAKAGKHLLRVGAEELCLCSVRDEELEVKELDIATKSESLTLALRLVSSIDILRGSSQIFFFERICFNI